MQTLNDLIASVDALTVAVTRVVEVLGQDTVPAADVAAQTARINEQVARLDVVAPPAPQP